MKNERLGFTIPYVHEGRTHEYVPDFLVRLVTEPDDVERTLIIEVSGSRKSPGPTAAKADTARNQWCAAVNNWGGFGRWGYVEVHNPADADPARRRHRQPVRRPADHRAARLTRGTSACQHGKARRTHRRRSTRSSTPTSEPTFLPLTRAPRLRHPGTGTAIPVRYQRDPTLDPQLVWKGKDVLDSEDLVVDAAPIYIQEKIDPRVLIENLRHTAERPEDEPELTLFETFDGLGELDLVDFYHHHANWSNRMILGDSLNVMASLAEREGLRGKVQMIYIDPPYGIKFGSNWQASARKRDVRDGKLEDASREVEQIKAFRDTWELGIHSTSLTCVTGWLSQRIC